MKADIYTVRGTSGPDKTEPVKVAVGDDGAGNWFASFVFRGVACLYRPRAMSPFPERAQPTRMHKDIQPIARSVARAAFSLAKEAAAEDAIHSRLDELDAAQESMSIDDIVIGGISRRSMGVAQ